MRQPKTIAEDSFVPRTTFARAIGSKTPSVARADKRGTGPGGAVHLEKNRVVYPLERIRAWCEKRNLEWTGSGIRPKPDAQAAP